MVYIAPNGLIYSEVMQKGLQFRIDKNALAECKHKAGVMIGISEQIKASTLNGAKEVCNKLHDPG